MHLRMRVGATLLALAASSSAQCQAVVIDGPSAMSILSSGGLPSSSADSALEIVREIEDSPLRTRWLLLRDWSHPGGPGRMVLAPDRWKESCGVLAKGAPGTIGRMPRPAIRAGDLVVVERNTAVVEARLEAIALEPAAVGASFHVRMRIGGKVARAVALAEGRAAFELEAGGGR